MLHVREICPLRTPNRSGKGVRCEITRSDSVVNLSKMSRIIVQGKTQKAGLAEENSTHIRFRKVKIAMPLKQYTFGLFTPRKKKKKTQPRFIYILMDFEPR